MELLVTDAGEMEEDLAEELRTQLSKPTLLFAFRNITGTIDPGEVVISFCTDRSSKKSNIFPFVTFT